MSRSRPFPIRLSSRSGRSPLAAAVILAALWAGSGLQAGDAEARLHIKPRHYSFSAPPGVEWVEKNTGYAWDDWKLPLGRTAIILLDVWEKHYLKDTETRSDEIIRQKIAPLVAEARAKGMTVIHCPGPEQGKDHPNLVRFPEALEAEKNPPRDWPPPEFSRRAGDFSGMQRAPSVGGPTRAKEIAEVRATNRIHPAVEPVEGEPVILTGAELHEYLKRNGITVLFFAAFNTNACLFTRTYSAWEMHKRGYGTVILRDCGTAMESFETTDTLAQTSNAILMLEMFGKFSLTSDELVAGLRELDSMPSR